MSTTPAPADRIESEAVLDLLTSLVQKSLVLYEEDAQGQGRYRLLETVRQYGQERLREEAERVRDRHRDFFLALAETAEPELVGRDQVAWFDRLEREHDNLRAALDWSQRGDEDLEKALRLAAALWWFWAAHNHGREGLTRLPELLARTEGAPPSPTRAQLLLGVANLTWWQGDLPLARSRYEQVQALFETLEAKPGVARCLNDRGLIAQFQGDLPTARALQERALALQRELGNKQGMAWSIHFLGNVALAEGDLERARLHYEEGLSQFREIGEKHGIATSLLPLGRVALEQGDVGRARSLHEQSLALYQELGHRGDIALSLLVLGGTARAQGDHEAARACYSESLAIGRQSDDRPSIAATFLKLGSHAVAELLTELALVEHDEKRPEQAAVLLGAAETLQEELRASTSSSRRQEHEQCAVELRALLGEAAFATAREKGRRMKGEQALRYALQEGADG